MERWVERGGDGGGQEEIFCPVGSSDSPAMAAGSGEGDDWWPGRTRPNLYARRNVDMAIPIQPSRFRRPESQNPIPYLFCTAKRDPDLQDQGQHVALSPLSLVRYFYAQGIEYVRKSVSGPQPKGSICQRERKDGYSVGALGVALPSLCGPRCPPPNPWWGPAPLRCYKSESPSGEKLP